jgi:hypothetical protein
MKFSHIAIILFLFSSFLAFLGSKSVVGLGKMPIVPNG